MEDPQAELRLSLAEEPAKKWHKPIKEIKRNESERGFGNCPLCDQDYPIENP